MNNRRRIILIILFLVCANAGSRLAQAASDSASVESAIWRFEFDNDVFFNKDSKISSDNVDTSKAPDADGQERLATADVEWRF